MRNIIYTITLATAFYLIQPSADYGQTTPAGKPYPKSEKVPSDLKYDTSKFAVIPYDTSFTWIFPKNCISATVTREDIEIIKDLLVKCVNEHNQSLKRNKPDFKIDLNRYHYKIQLMAVINSKNEKEIWVNCFCTTFNNNWKKEVQIVMDGGSCFFNFKVNLAKRTYYDMRVNGIA